MATDVKTHTLEATKGGLTLLKRLMAQPSWYEGETKLSFGLDVESIQMKLAIDPLKMPEDSAPEQQDAWADEVVSVEGITENERDAAKKCIKYFYKKAAFQLNKHTGSLIRTLGLINASV